MKGKFFLFLIAFWSLVLVSQASVMRVALTLRAPTIELFCPTDFEVHLANGQPVFLGKSAHFKAENEGISLNGRTFKSQRLFIHAKAPFVLDKRHYRGDLQIQRNEGSLDAINMVDLEEYLYSVVGSEMSPKWPLEALKAQAVVARTYALEKKEENKTHSYDLLGSYADQAYDGTESETTATLEAVNQTQGEVLRYHGELITAYYHSDCGGKTEVGSNVFTGDLPYLQSVVCPYGNDSPYQHWEKTYSLTELSDRLGKTIENISAQKNAETGRVASISLTTPSGTVTMSGHDFRKLMGSRDLRSTAFILAKHEKTIYVPQEKHLPPEMITRYIQKQIPKPTHESVTENVSPGGKIYLIHRSGGLMEEGPTLENPLIVIAKGSFLFSVYQNLATQRVKITYVSMNIMVPEVVEGPERIKTVMVPMTVPESITLTGKGWGHGVGLCQWGARGMALLGKHYTDILHYYYKEVELTK